jgi:hypothetical protein
VQTDVDSQECAGMEEGLAKSNSGLFNAEVERCSGRDIDFQRLVVFPGAESKSVNRKLVQLAPQEWVAANPPRR